MTRIKLRTHHFSLPALPLALVAAAILFTGCQNKAADTQLAANVQGQLSADPALQGQPISATADNGTVTLTGTASDDASRQDAAADAVKVPGVHTLVNKLAVKNAAALPPTAPGSNAMNEAPANAPPVSRVAPRTAFVPQAPVVAQPIVIPAGTRIRVRLSQTISTKTSNTGDPFSGTVVSPILVNGQTIVREGSQANGFVSTAKAQGRMKGEAVLAVRLESIRADGRTYTVRTAHVERVEKGKGKRTAVMTGGGAGLGAIIGGIAGGGKGALIGGLVGGGGGAAGSAFTGSHDLVLPAETVLTFVLENSVTVRR